MPRGEEWEEAAAAFWAATASTATGPRRTRRGGRRSAGGGATKEEKLPRFRRRWCRQQRPDDRRQQERSTATWSRSSLRFLLSRAQRVPARLPRTQARQGGAKTRPRRRRRRRRFLPRPTKHRPAAAKAEPSRGKNLFAFQVYFAASQARVASHSCV